jgi:hypothetical protein
LVQPLRADRPRVLLVVGYYLPGFKAGGILRSVANIVDHLHLTFNFLVLTRDHDFGDHAPYPGLSVGGWQRIGHASVRYLTERETSIEALRQIVDEAACDAIYLNSFFEPICIKVLANLRRGRNASRPVVLAPRGEFAWPSLRIKYPKKLAFMLGARVAGMFRDVTWHAANEVEAAEIRRTMGVHPESLAVAIDLPTLRPEAPEPTRAASSTRQGTPARARARAAPRPVKPAPTMHTPVRTSPSGAGSSGRRTAAVSAYQEPLGWPSLRMAGRQTFSRRNSRSQGLMVCMKVSYSARFTVA